MGLWMEATTDKYPREVRTQGTTKSQASLDRESGHWEQSPNPGLHSIVGILELSVNRSEPANYLRSFAPILITLGGAEETISRTENVSCLELSGGKGNV